MAQRRDETTVGRSGSARRTRGTILIFLLLTFIGGHLHAHSPDDIDWQTDFDTAITQVKPGKVVLFVQFDTDFLKPVLDSQELRNFQSHSFDETTLEWLKQNAVLICEPVGMPSQIRLHYGKDNSPDDRIASVNSIGTCVIWICDFNGFVCDLMVGLPDSKTLLQKTKAASNFLNRKVRRSHEDFVQWHLPKVQPADREFYGNVKERLAANDGLRRSTLNEETTIKYAIRAAARSRELWMQERFGRNWNRKTLTRFASFESQFFSMMLASLPFQKVSDLEKEVWESVVGQWFWKADQRKLATWIEEQRHNNRAILLRIGSRKRDDVWPRPSDKELIRLVDRYAVLHDSSPADAAFMLSYFNAGPQTISANHQPSFFVSTSRGDICHLLTEKTDRQLPKVLTSIQQTEARRKK